MNDSMLYGAFVDEANEDISYPAELVAFTWTPDPSKYPTNVPRTQYKCLLNYVLLSSHKCFDKFCFVPEINIAGNVHIHGWFIIKDKYKYYKWFIPKCKGYGFIYIKKGNIDDKWKYDYLEKDIGDTINILGQDMPIPLTHLNIDAYRSMFDGRMKCKNVKKSDVFKKMDIKHLFKRMVNDNALNSDNE